MEVLVEVEFGKVYPRTNASRLRLRVIQHHQHSLTITLPSVNQSQIHSQHIKISFNLPKPTSLPPPLMLYPILNPSRNIRLSMRTKRLKSPAHPPTKPLADPTLIPLNPTMSIVRRANTHHTCSSPVVETWSPTRLTDRTNAFVALAYDADAFGTVLAKDTVVRCAIVLRGGTGTSG
jgi:hypothetical protein